MVQIYSVLVLPLEIRIQSRTVLEAVALDMISSTDFEPVLCTKSIVRIYQWSSDRDIDTHKVYHWENIVTTKKHSRVCDDEILHATLNYFINYESHITMNHRIWVRNFELTCHSRRQRGIIKCTKYNCVHQNESHKTWKTFLVTQSERSKRMKLDADSSKGLSLRSPNGLKTSDTGTRDLRTGNDRSLDQVVNTGNILDTPK